MSQPDSPSPHALLRGARRIARVLKQHGHEAWFVGGCVRDRLLGRPLKDIDLATDARPDQVLRLFPRTLAVGAQFGVIVVIEHEAQYEVATFRAEADYTDGRRPSRIEFVNAEADVLRRDFTINGLLEHPETGEVVDFVGGRADLAAGVVRAIGAAAERFEEDHLRMLRAVRFSACLRFRLDESTLQACRASAPQIRKVAAERVAHELRRASTEAEPATVVGLLDATGLLECLLPEVDASTLEVTQAALRALGPSPLPVVLATLLPRSAAAGVAERLKLSRAERDHLVGVADLRAALDEAAARAPGAAALRTVRALYFPEAARVEHAVRVASGRDVAAVEQLTALLAATPGDRLNPPRLVDGNDLRRAGLRPGPDFKRRLDAVEDAQLEGRVTTPEAALELALAS